MTIQDEYDTDKLCGYIEKQKRMMIRAEYGGCGKSYTCKSMETRGHKVLFACPTNKLANHYKEHGCTINKLFSVRADRGHQYGQVRLPHKPLRQQLQGARLHHQQALRYRADGGDKYGEVRQRLRHHRLRLNMILLP
ncbi:MAG: hypothetical protein ACKPKO_02420, partial [Candidatus Fonsibacter sp.]